MQEQSLLPFQHLGKSFLTERNHAGLFDEMGLGKTIEGVAAADSDGAERILVVAPHIGLMNWQREIESWSRPHNRTIDILTNDSPLSAARWQLVNYDLLQEDTRVLRVLQQQRFDLMMLDEAQALKNHLSNRTKNVLGARGIARTASKVWALSGTPAPNHVGELYPLLRAMYPKALHCQHGLMTYMDFLDKYADFTETEYGVNVKRNKNMPALRALLKPFALRRTAKEVLPQLPPIRYSALTFAPDTEALALIRSDEMTSVTTALKAAVGKVMRRGERDSDYRDPDADLIEAMNTMDSEYLATARRLFGEALAPQVAHQVAYEVFNGLDKIVVFFHHRHVGDYLYECLAPLGCSLINGDTPPQRRQDMIDEFQVGKTRIFLAQLDVAHRVITLTAAADVLFAEASWTPGINQQAARRCARIGQGRPVRARFAVLAGSMHENIMTCMLRKARNLATLWDEDEDMSNALESKRSPAIARLDRHAERDRLGTIGARDW